MGLSQTPYSRLPAVLVLKSIKEPTKWPTDVPETAVGVASRGMWCGRVGNRSSPSFSENTNIFHACVS